MSIVSDKKTTLIRRLRDSTAQWAKGDGPLNHIVVCTRIRLARNLSGIPFPFKANDEQLRQVLIRSEGLIKNNKHFSSFQSIKLSDLNSRDIQFLIEKRLISIALARLTHPYRAFIYRQNELINVLINEEEHIRIQCLLSGLQLKKAWKIIRGYDRKIVREIEYAFDEKEGFLTSCPTNVGTGLRASVMLHLPALLISNKLGEIMSAIVKKGYAVRGFYGEGTNIQGNFFQVSNQITLGLTEEEILDKFEIETKKLIIEEEKSREELILYHKTKIEDQIKRAYGILSNAKIISTKEATELLSKVRFGIELGMLTKIGYDTINRLMLIIQPGYLQLLKNQKMNKDKRDLFRAELIQELLPS